MKENFRPKGIIKDIIATIFGLGFIVTFIVLLTLMVRTELEKSREFKNFVNESIGKEVVIQGDTLTVVSYQDGGFGNVSGFMLSNGVIIDEKLIKEQ